MLEKISGKWTKGISVCTQKKHFMKGEMSGMDQAFD